MKKNNNQIAEESKIDNIEALQEQIISLEKEVSKNLEGWKRAQADYQNLKKESEQKSVDSIKFASRQIVESFIPVFDNFALALKHMPNNLESDNWVQGIIYIYKQLQDILLEEGVEIIDPKGQIFDPNMHEAVESVESEEGIESNTVVEVLQVGYSLNGALIRSARVKVSL